MRFMMTLGGLVGFSIGLAFGLANNSAWPGVIWRASLAALAAGWLMRWWGQVWIRSLQQAQHDRTAQTEPAQNTARTNL